MRELDTLTPQAEFTFSGEKIQAMQRRTAVRYRCALATVGRLSLPGGVTLETWILNLSETGIGLNLDRPLAPGTTLVVHLRGQTPDADVQLPAEVDQETSQPDITWRLCVVF